MKQCSWSLHVGLEGLQFVQSVFCENELTLLLVKALEIFASREIFLLTWGKI